ncbi:MAG TPA: ADOP family duplicated permease [Vicinamibacterales bacterium]|jgi:predicted permease|nr:ADOP family duplicated permease [Vicinamibacterales bacterium]
MQDLRRAIRALRTTPVVSAVAILSLALGIGANTAIFSLVNSLLLRPLPVTDPQRLVMVSTEPGETEQYSHSVLDEIRRYGGAFDGAFAWSLGGKSILGFGATTETVEHQFVSGDYFLTLGVRPVLGRAIGPADDVDGGGPDGPVVMISYGLWRQRFGGSANVVGAKVRVDRTTATIVGVTPPDFFGLVVGRGFDITLPIRAQRLVQPATPLTDTMSWLTIMLRMKPSQSLDAATMALRAVQPQIREGATPYDILESRSFLKAPFMLTPAGAGLSPLRGRFERPLVMILVVVALMLVIACANIANLMLARGTARRHELSVRIALGASGWQLARQLLTESVVLAAIGAIAGVAFGAWASRAIVLRLSTSAAPVVLDPSLDWRVLTFTAVMAGATAVLFGAAPAHRAARVSPIEALKEQGRDATAGMMGSRLTSGLVITQVALSLVLVVVAGLFVTTFERLVHAPLGLDRDHVLVVTVTAPTVPAVERNVLYHRLVRAVADVPGVAASGGSLNPPIIGSLRGDLVFSEPGTEPRADALRVSQGADVTPGWFAAYGMPVSAGRDFDDHDTVGTRPVMVVNEAFVRHFFPDRNPIGHSLAMTFRTAPFGDIPLDTRTIVGVVGDAVYRTIREAHTPTTYRPLAQRDDPLLFTSFFITLRASGGSPVLLTRSVSAALTGMNRDLGLTFRPLAAQVDDMLAQDRVVAILSGFFGALALLLAAVGLYGVTAYAVARRRTEIGIRAALGAAPLDIFRLVLLRVALLVGAGVIIGAGVGVWASTLVGSLLYGLEPHDSRTLVGAVAVLAAVGAAAGWLPAWRASRTDPAEELRES